MQINRLEIHQPYASFYNGIYNQLSYNGVILNLFLDFETIGTSSCVAFRVVFYDGDNDTEIYEARPCNT